MGDWFARPSSWPAPLQQLPSSSTRPTHGLEREWLTSSDVFDTEMEQIFGRHWLAVSNRSTVENAGTFVPFRIAGQSGILNHGHDGQLRAISNVCRHRGCELVPPLPKQTGDLGADSGAAECPDQGRTHNGAFRCPYHGWTYREDGRLAAAPNMAEQPDFSADEFSLPSAKVECWSEQCFVNFSQLSGSLAGWLEPLMNIAADWVKGPLYCAKRIDYQINANWKLLFQNFSECYHCRFVHPGLNARTRFDTASNDLVAGPILGGPMVLNDDSASMTTHGSLCGDLFPGLKPDQARRVFYFTVFPNLFVSPHPDYLMIHRLYPESIEQTRIECEFLFADSCRSRSDFDPSAAADFWDEVNRQDWEVCESTQVGVKSRSYRPGRYSPSESMVAEFDRYYRAAFCAPYLA